MKERHKQIKDFIVQYLKTHGYAPSYQEIGVGVGLYSKQSVHENIQQMNDLGIIKAVPGKPRCISMPGCRFVEEDEQ